MFGFGQYVTGVFQPFLEKGTLNEGFGWRGSEGVKE